jgi:hypothetical protein
MTQLNEEHFEVIDRNKAKRYPEQKIKKARDTLREILKTHYYDIKGPEIIPDIIGSRVAKKLEDLVGYLK